MADWEIATLKDVCNNIYTGNSINESVKIEKYTNISDGYDYIATKDVLSNHQICYNNGVKIPMSEKKFKIAHKGATLLCIEGGSAGKKIGIIDKDVCFGNKLCCFEPNDSVLSKFLFYYLQSPTFTNLFSNSLSGLIGGVTKNSLRELEVRIPPIKVQQKIVDSIEGVFSQLDKILLNLV